MGVDHSDYRRIGSLYRGLSSLRKRRRSGKELGLSQLVTQAAKLRDRFARPEEYVGYRVRDPLGQKVGSVERLFVNDRGEPEYIRVKIGLFGLKSVLLPVEGVAVEEERRVLLLK